MEVRHVPGNKGSDVEPDERVLAADVEIADTIGAQTKGLMFRDEVPEGYALVFQFDDPAWWIPDFFAHLRSIHMLFVKVPLDVLWIREGRVRQVSTLSPWTGIGLARADTIVELPAGAAEAVAVGDRVLIAEGDGAGASDPTD